MKLRSKFCNTGMIYCQNRITYSRIIPELAYFKKNIFKAFLLLKIICQNVEFFWSVFVGFFLTKFPWKRGAYPRINYSKIIPDLAYFKKQIGVNFFKQNFHENGEPIPQYWNYLLPEYNNIFLNYSWISMLKQNWEFLANFFRTFLLLKMFRQNVEFF
jgi:hypothetical protein